MNRPEVELLAVVEVEKDKRVYCQSKSCTKTVYKRIHVVKDNNEVLVLGSKCYSIIYGSAISEPAYYTFQNVRTLSDEERILLADNTTALIDQFEAEREAALKAIEPDNKVALSRQITKTSPVPVDNFPVREVKCNYCKKAMFTTLNFMPGSGHKCDECRATKKMLPPTNRFGRRK